MSDETLTVEEWRLAEATAYHTARKYEGIDEDEVLGDIGEWIAKHWREVIEWRDVEHGMKKLKKSFRNAAHDSCRRQVLLDKGASPDDHQSYTTRQIRALLADAIDPAAWDLPPGTGYSETPRVTSDPALGGDRLVQLLDIRDAFHSLSGGDQRVMRAAAACGWDYGVMAGYFEDRAAEQGYDIEVTPDAAQQRIWRRISHMKRFLGDPSPYRQYVGDRGVGAQDITRAIERQDQ